MWSKISGALSGSRRGVPSPEELAGHAPSHDDDETGVFSAVLNAHPNLSVFHDDELKDLPTVPEAMSPPPQQKRGMLKRLSKVPSSMGVGGEAPLPSPGPSLKLGFGKKVKSSVNLGSQSSQASLSSRETGSMRARMSSDTATSASRPSMDSVRTPATPIEGRFGSIRSILKDKNTPATGQSVRFFSRDAYKTISPDISSASEALDDTPLIERLQDAQLSPNGDKVTLPRAGTRKPLVQDLFAPPSAGTTTPPMSPTDSLKLQGGFTPLPPPEISGIFDLASRDLPPIPAEGNPLLDDAVEVFEGDSSRDSGFSMASSSRSQTSHASSAPGRVEGGPVFVAPSHDRSHSFSFGSSVFRAPEPQTDGARLSASALAEAYPGRPPSRNRAMSDTMFQSLLRSSTPRPEADIRDTSNASLILEPKRSKSKAKNKPPPDPFSANATTYYTPGTVLPPSPPQIMHRRTASVEEDALWQLRTQLAVQMEMAAQYEVDLRARDALVSALTASKEALERDEAKRTKVIRALKRKCAEFEGIIGNLQEAVDSSREESFERSMMDAASEVALRSIQEKLGSAQRENAELRREAEKARRAEEEASAKLKEKEAKEQEMADGIAAAQEQIELLTAAAAEGDTGKFSLHSAKSRHSANVQAEWAEERARLAEDAAALTNQLDRTRETLLKREDEVRELKAEVEAQWKNTEVSGETIDGLRREKEELESRIRELEAAAPSSSENDEQVAELQRRNDSLAREIAELKQCLDDARANTGSTSTDEDKAELASLKTELEAQWRHAEVSDAEIVSLKSERDVLQASISDLETRIDALESELDTAREELDAADQLVAEKNELEQHLRDEQDRVDELTVEMQARQDRVDALENELRFAKDSTAIAERNLSERNTELEDLAQRFVKSEDDVEDLREQLSTARREAERAKAEAARVASELSNAQSGVKMQIEEAVRDKAAAEVECEGLRSRVEKAEAEVEKLRKSVHLLRQESASKDLEVQKAMKERDAAKEDVFNMNLALDSKQQELEMVKRKQGSAQASSAPSASARASLVGHRRDSSVPSATPASGSASRPSSRLSETSSGAESSELRKSVVRAPSTMTTPKPAASTAASRRLSTLTKSTSVNAGMSTPTPAGLKKPRVDGAMGPPPSQLKPRPSVTGTPGHSRVPSLQRSTATRPGLNSSMSTPTGARRTSSSGSVGSKLSGLRSPPPGPVREEREKENVTVGGGEEKEAVPA